MYVYNIYTVTINKKNHINEVIFKKKNINLI